MLLILYYYSLYLCFDTLVHGIITSITRTRSSAG